MINLKVNETFTSFQGEISVGRYAHFIRLGGCNLNCVFCFGARKNNGKLPYITYSKDKNKRLDKVKKGDVLLTLDENHNLVETTVKEVFEREVNEWYIVKIGKHNYYVTPEHEFFTTKGLKSVKELKINDEIFNVDFKEKISYRMKNNNPMFNQDIVDKSVMNTDYNKQGISVSKAIQKRKDKGIYYSAWSVLSEDTKNRLRKLAVNRQLGEKNSNWKGGKNKNFNRLKKLCQSSELNICKICNEKNKLEVHHLDKNKENDYLINLTTICHSCHSKIHKRGYNFWKNDIRTDLKILSNERIDVMNDFLALQHNGIKVNSIKYFNRNDKEKYKYKSIPPPEPLKVYNLKCEPYNTYLADWMWSHNCDTDYARDSFVDMTIEEVFEKAKHFDRVIITGGEPFLQKEEVAKLTKKLINNKSTVKVEIETNGTIKPVAVSNFNNIIYNVSLKLKNSGNDKNDRLKDNVIKWFVQAEANFKFVVQNENDVDEVNMIVTEYGIPKSQVFLMPEGKTTKEQLDRMENIISFAKQYGYNFTPRFHVLLWGDKRGV